MNKTIPIAAVALAAAAGSVYVANRKSAEPPMPEPKAASNEEFPISNLDMQFSPPLPRMGTGSVKWALGNHSGTGVYETFHSAEIGLWLSAAGMDCTIHGRTAFNYDMGEIGVIGKAGGLDGELRRADGSWIVRPLIFHAHLLGASAVGEASWEGYL